MNDKTAKKKALKNLTDKEKFEALKLIEDRKKKLSPEAGQAYEDSMKDQMDMKDEGEDEVERQAEMLRARMRRRKAASSIKEE